MKFKNLIIVLTIAFSAIFTLMIGTSYAYYVFSDGTTIKVTTGNVDTGIAVVFEQSQYINVNTGVPISASDVDTLAASSVFTLTPDATVLKDSDVAVNISIIDIYIDDALKVEDFKYKFTCNDGSSDVLSTNGNGTNFTDDVISSGAFSLGTLSTSNSTFDIKKTYTCNLRVWLNETEEDQNALMNKKFRGLIKVNTIFRSGDNNG